MPRATNEPQRLAQRLFNARLRAKRAGQPLVVLELNRQLSVLNFKGVRPEVRGPMIAHCGRWHEVSTSLPMLMPCCGTVMLVWDQHFQ